MKWWEYRGELTNEVSKHTSVVMLMMLVQGQNMSQEDDCVSELKECYKKDLFENRQCLLQIWDMIE